jgi:two-component system CheB/CheR fusion protein
VATDGVLLLAPPEKKSERYLPIDIFFTSLAIVHQSHSIGIILSGTGTDGTLGLKPSKITAVLPSYKTKNLQHTCYA